MTSSKYQSPRKKIKEEVKVKTHQCIIYGKMHSSFYSKDSITSIVPKKNRSKREMRLPSIILKATAEMYQARTPAAGSVSSAKGFTLWICITLGECQYLNMY
jgi:hypothetical protein